jgi:hypothetical protein
MMEHIVRSVQRACASGLDSATLRQEVVRRIAPAIPFDAYAFSACDPDTGLMAHTVAHNVPRALGRVYAEHLYPHQAATIAMDLPRRGVPVFSMLDMSRDIREVFRAAGLDHQIHVSLTSAGRLRGTWCLMRSACSSREIARSRALIERVLPHVTRGLEAAALVDLARSPSIETSDAAPGILMLDARGHIVVRTPLGSRWLADLADAGLGTDGVFRSASSRSPRGCAAHAGIYPRRRSYACAGHRGSVTCCMRRYPSRTTMASARW